MRTRASPPGFLALVKPSEEMGGGGLLILFNDKSSDEDRPYSHGAESGPLRLSRNIAL